MALLRPFQEIPLRVPPGGDLTGIYAGLEARKYEKDTEVVDENFNLFRLDGSEVEDWALERGSFLTTKSDTHKGGLESRIRVLFAQANSKSRNPIPDRLRGSVLHGLNLPLTTLTSFEVGSGGFSTHTYPEGTTIDECSTLRLVLYTPQKWETSVGGLAISHDFAISTTTALILGYEFALHDFKGRPTAHLQKFVERIRDCQQHWGHPFLLPSVFLTGHTLKVQDYVRNQVSTQVIRIEHNIGVTKAGRTGSIKYMRPSPDEVLYVDGQLQRKNVRKLTSSINDLSTWIIFAKRSPQWDIDCVNFLLNLLSTTPRFKQCKSVSTYAIKEVLEVIRMHSEASLEVTQTSQARMQLQLNILYTLIAQDDNQTSARLAASAGKDSTSMKILALITAAYLPGTFVASLFSMSMFDWSSGDKGSVASSFWIYWAVAVPLTIVTLGGWGLWWHIEKKRSEINVQRAETSKDIPATLEAIS